MHSKQTTPKPTDIFFRWYVTPIKSEYILRLFTGNELKILVALAAFLNEENSCYPTLSHIAYITGYKYSSTVCRILCKLANKKIAGEPVIRKEKFHRTGSQYTNNLYRLSSKIGIKIFGASTCSDDHSLSDHCPNSQHKDSPVPKDTQREEEEPTGMGTSFKERGNALTPVSDLIASSHLPPSKDLTFEIKKVAAHLSKKYSSYSNEVCIRIVKSHIGRLGRDDWLDLYHKFLPNRIAFYCGITFKVKQEHMTYKAALAQWDSEQIN